jgi:hypothetical protein
MNAVTQAREALNALAEAMVSGDADRVLAHELALSAAAADLTFMARAGAAPASVGEKLTLRAEIHQARAALDRCRALGANTAALSAVLFASPTGYSASGTLQVAPGSSSFFPTSSYSSGT